MKLHKVIIGASVIASQSLLTAETIDLMIVYTQATANANGGDAGARALVNAAVASTNNALSKSKTNANVRLVHSEKVDYTESSPGQDLRSLQGTRDGFMDNIHATRTEKGADLVAMLTDSSRWGRVAGIGYIFSGNSRSSNGFSATGYRYVTSGLTFPHEIGHNLGCGHDSQNGRGYRSYSNGWRFNGDDGRQYRTVMAYAPGRRTDLFSSPDLSFRGQPTGVANQADNVRTIKETNAAIANYRPTRVSGGGNPTPPAPTPPPAPPTTQPLDPNIARIFNGATGTAQQASTWMGQLRNISFPNVTHEFMGDIRIWERSSTSSLYFNADYLGGWCYTRRGTYPNIYRFSTREWLQYREGSRNPRVFYNYRTRQNETF